MNLQVAAYEKRLREESTQLERMESDGCHDSRYRRALQRWLELLAAYEFECEMADNSSLLPAVV